MLFQLKKQHYGLTIGYFCLIFWLSLATYIFFYLLNVDFIIFHSVKFTVFYFIYLIFPNFFNLFVHLSALISLLCLANIWLIVFFPCIFIDFKGDLAATLTFCFWLCVCLFFLSLPVIGFGDEGLEVLVQVSHNHMCQFLTRLVEVQTTCCVDETSQLLHFLGRQTTQVELNQIQHMD